MHLDLQIFTQATGAQAGTTTATGATTTGAQAKTGAQARTRLGLQVFGSQHTLHSQRALRRHSIRSAIALTTVRTGVMRMQRSTQLSQTTTEVA